MVVAALTAPLASGHPSPLGCTQDAFSFDWGPGLNIVHRNRDVFTINAKVGNDHLASGVCDVTDATVKLTFPNADGTSNGQEFVLATGVDFPGGAPMKSFGKRDLHVNFDPGVFRGFVTISASGTVHAGNPDFPTATSSGRPLVISRPHVTFTVTPHITLAPPFTVTYAYSAENDSPSDPAGEMSNPTPGVLSAAVADDHCSPVNFVDGDTMPSFPPIIDKGDSSPDGAWVVAIFTGEGEQRSVPGTTIRSIRGGPPTPICPLNCPATFSADGRWLYVTLLGIGADGHTASLFPGQSALEEDRHWAVPVAGPRITLTYPALGSSRDVAFLVAGAEKKEILRRVRAGDRTLPAARIRPAGRLHWFTDRAAAGA